MVFRRLINCLAFGLIVIIGLSVSGCDDKVDTDRLAEKTLFMYFPWSNNLTGYFRTNISDMEQAISRRGLENEHVIVFFSTAPDEAELYEIVCKKGKCEHNILKRYTDPAFTTSQGITGILNDVKSFAPARTYAMTIGCHGMGWIPVYNSRARSLVPFKYHWDVDGAPLTRFFGGTEKAYQTDVTALADGIANAGMTMEFILFDDCYMASVEVAYDLRHVTGHLIASTCEMMAYGLPYARIGAYLLGTPDYQAICDHFYEFYSAYNLPYGTLSVIDCSQLDALAEVMNEINARYTFDTSLLGYLQRLDGYSPTIFYDMGDYVSTLNRGEHLQELFEEQLARTVIYSVHTDEYYTTLSQPNVRPIHSFSGLTISDPSTSSEAVAKTNTAWWKATHRSTTY